jgi:hypothetical protein
MNATFRLVDFEWTRRGRKVDTKNTSLQKPQGWTTRPLPFGTRGKQKAAARRSLTGSQGKVKTRTLKTQGCGTRDCAPQTRHASTIAARTVDNGRWYPPIHRPCASRQGAEGPICRVSKQ